MISNKVCIIVQNYYETDPRVKREASALIEAGYQVDVLALRSKRRPQKEFIEDSVRVTTVPIEKKRAGKINYILEYALFFILAGFKLAVKSFKNRYKIIHVCTPPDFLVFSAIMPKLLGAKIVLDIHDVMPEFYMTKFNVPEGHIIIKLIKFQENISTRFANHVITANHLFKDLLTSRSLHPDKVTVILNLPDDSIFKSDAAIRWPRSTQPNFRLIYTGTIGARHGLQTAIKALALLVDEIPGIQLYVVGDGDYKPELIRLAKSLNLDHHVIFDPPVSLERIPQLLEEADVGICLQEGQFNEIAFPTKVPEYMTMNLPVVVSGTKITRLYFDPEMVAFVPPADPETFANHIRTLYQDQIKTLEMIKKAQQFSSKWSWNLEKKKYIDVVNSLSN